MPPGLGQRERRKATDHQLDTWGILSIPTPYSRGPEGRKQRTGSAEDSNARRPSYDLAHYAARLRAEGVTRSRLGEVSENPEYGRAERPVPWSEQHKWLLWAALIALGVVLGLLVYRQAKSAPALDEEQSSRGMSDGEGKA